MFIKKCTIGRDSEVRFTKNGDAVASVSLAYNYGKKGQDGKYPTQWVEASLWGKRAESLAQHLTKGSQIVAVIKDFHLETYQKNDGTQGTKLSGILDDLEFCGGKSEQAPKERTEKTEHKAQEKSGYNDFPDDLPFAPHGKQGAGVSWRVM